MKKRILPLLFSALLMLTACGGAASGAAYQEISQEKAKEMMDTQEVLILDVREQEEYDSGTIKIPCVSCSTSSGPEKESPTVQHLRFMTFGRHSTAAQPEVETNKLLVG